MEKVEELLQKLQPIIGKEKCKDWWLTYITESPKGRKEIEQYLHLRASEALGVDYTAKNVLLPPPPKDVAQQGSYHVGKIYYGNKPFYAFNLREDEWLSHLVIVGRSGSGKTNTVFHLIEQLIAHKKPFWVFDFKRNYRDLIFEYPSLQIYTVGRNTSNISYFNPLVPIGDPHNHIRFVVSLLCKTFYLGEGAHSLLIKCLDEHYKHFGVYEGNVKKYPTFKHVQTWLELYKPQSGARDGQWRISTVRAMKVLNFGPMGRALNSQKKFSLKDHLGKRIIFELDALSRHDKIFFVGLLLYYRHTYKLAHAQREKLQDVLIVEEAHHLLPKKSFSEQESILEKFLREERELGTSLVIIDQLASRLSDIAFANTATTIALNQKHRADINTIANAVLLDVDEKKILSKLKVGCAIVRQQERWSAPFVVKVPLFKIQKGKVTDEDIKNHMRVAQKERTTKQTKKQDLDFVSLRMLQSVAQNSTLPVVQRYKKLQISAGKGHAIKNKLLEQLLIKQTSVVNKQGVKVFLQLTPKGKFILQLYTQKQAKIVSAGSAHEYFKKKLAQQFRQKGCTVQIEPQLADGSRPDLLVDNTTAVEIETGKSKHWLKHIVLHITNGRNVIVATTNQEAYEHIITKLKKNGLFAHENIKVIRSNP